MLLVFGFKIRLSTVASLVLFCPTCGGDRVGARRSARRWFTLFWIPLLPLNRVGEVVECETCHTRYDPSVADQPTTASLAAILDDAVRVLTAMIVRTGRPESAVLRYAAVDHVARVLPAYDDAVLAGDVAALDPALAEQYVAPLADGLEVTGKERLVADLVRVAMADGTVTADQRRIIDLTGRGLGLTPTHVTGIVTSVVADRTPDPDPGQP
jgi:hypothetical protein